MVMTIIKAGGYIMRLNVLVNQVKAVRQSKATAKRRDRAKNIAIGTGIGHSCGQCSWYYARAETRQGNKANYCR